MSSLVFEDRPVYLACGVTDMRKSIDGLRSIVEESFELDPMGSALFVFCNRRHNRIKILEWDQDGFWLHFKRFEGVRMRWPDDTTADPTMMLTPDEFENLLEAPKLEKMIKGREAKPAKPSPLDPFAPSESAGFDRAFATLETLENSPRFPW